MLWHVLHTTRTCSITHTHTTHALHAFLSKDGSKPAALDLPPFGSSVHCQQYRMAQALIQQRPAIFIISLDTTIAFPSLSFPCLLSFFWFSFHNVCFCCFTAGKAIADLKQGRRHIHGCLRTRLMRALMPRAHKQRPSPMHSAPHTTHTQQRFTTAPHHTTPHHCSTPHTPQRCTTAPHYTP